MIWTMLILFPQTSTLLIRKCEELLRQLAFHQKNRRSHNETDVRHI